MKRVKPLETFADKEMVKLTSQVLRRLEGPRLKGLHDGRHELGDRRVQDQQDNLL